MTPEQAKIGVRVKSNVEFAGVPKGTEGVIDEDYGTGIMVAWELPNDPWFRNNIRPLRDGFDKAKELKFLDVV